MTGRDFGYVTLGSSRRSGLLVREAYRLVNGSSCRGQIFLIFIQSYRGCPVHVVGERKNIRLKEN